MGSAGCTGSFWADLGLDQNTKFGTDKHNLVSKNLEEQRGDCGKREKGNSSNETDNNKKAADRLGA